MNAMGSVTADELVRALARRGASLPVEIGTFMVLEACEAMLANGPRALAGLTHLRISEAGATSLSGPACDDEQGARSLHRCLGALLEAAGPRLPPPLSRLIENGPPGEGFTLRALRDELEAALVPLNRNASRRVLARFARDAGQAPIEPEDVDAALNSLLDGHEPANDVASRPSQTRLSVDGAAEARARQELKREEASFLGGPVATPLQEPLGERRSPSIRPSFAPKGERDSLHGLRARTLELEERESDGSSRKLLIGFSLLALAVAVVIVALSLRNRSDAPRASEHAVLESDLAREESGDLIVHVPDRDAQVLRFVGRAPITVSNLPVGAAHEFVATAEGHRPARALVAADAEWEATPEGARYEVALQLPDAAGAAADAALELGPSRLKQQVGTLGGRLGSVRVVATPRGARVYQLLGFAPTVEVRDVPLGEPEELLVYREGSPPVVRVVAPSDFKQQGDRRIADITITLMRD